MSFYDDASWLLIPSGIEEDVVFAQKPTSGLGDLTFTRASDATYTDSTGVVRRSPYNLLQQSEDFSNAAWSKSASSISSNVTTALVLSSFITRLLLRYTMSDLPRSMLVRSYSPIPQTNERHYSGLAKQRID